MRKKADCRPSLHMRGLGGNLEKAAVHLVIELKNAAPDLMAAESPNCKLVFFAAGARSTINTAGTQISAPQGSGKIGHSSIVQRRWKGQFTGRGTNRTYAGAAIADAAFIRMCGSLIAAPRSVSPNRSFL